MKYNYLEVDYLIINLHYFIAAKFKDTTLEIYISTPHNSTLYKVMRCTDPSICDRTWRYLSAWFLKLTDDFVINYKYIISVDSNNITDLHVDLPEDLLTEEEYIKIITNNKDRIYSDMRCKVLHI